VYFTKYNLYKSNIYCDYYFFVKFTINVLKKRYIFFFWLLKSKNYILPPHKNIVGFSGEESSLKPYCRTIIRASFCWQNNNAS